MITTRAAATFDTKIFQICFVPILSLSLITRPLKSYLIPNREVVLSSNYHFSTAFAVQLRGGIYIYINTRFINSIEQSISLDSWYLKVDLTKS